MRARPPTSPYASVARKLLAKLTLTSLVHACCALPQLAQPIFCCNLLQCKVESRPPWAYRSRDTPVLCRHMQGALQQAATDPVTGAIDMDKILTGTSAAERTARAQLAQELTALLLSARPPRHGTFTRSAEYFQQRWPLRLSVRIRMQALLGPALKGCLFSCCSLHRHAHGGAFVPLHASALVATCCAP